MFIRQIKVSIASMRSLQIMHGIASIITNMLFNWQQGTIGPEYLFQMHDTATYRFRFIPHRSGVHRMENLEVFR